MGTHPIFESDFDCLTAKMAIESSLSSYQRREAKKKQYAENQPTGRQATTQFQPRAIKVKKEPTEEMDFATRMKMMSGKAAPKRGLMVKKEVKEEELSSDEEYERERRQRKKKK